MKIISLFLKSSTTKFLIAAISGVLSGLCLTGIIQVIHEAIDSHMAETANLTIRFVSLWVLYGLTSYLSVRTIVELSEDVILYLRKMVSDKILKASFQSMESSQHELLSILTTDINIISYGINRLPNVITAAAMLVGCIAYMAIISWQLLAMFALLILIALFFYNLPMHAYKNRMQQSREIQNKLFEYFEALIYGLKELSLSRNLRESFKENQLYPASEEQRNHNVRGSIRLTLISKWGEMLLLIGLGAMLFMIQSFGWSTYESFAKFLTVALFLLPALQRISGFLPVLGKMNVSLEQIEKKGLELDQNKEPRAILLEARQQVGTGLIQLEEITFSYYHADEKKFFQLGPINLSINKGDLVYLVGGNGSGKSTLAKVLSGLYLPETGTVFFNGEKVDSSNLSAYRENYGAIFFDFYLFDQLSHIKSDYWKSKAEEYLKLLELDEKVWIEGEKLNTTKLSTGQRKRLALLMSLLEDKPFYLFDEWAASQDPYYKNVFYNVILPDLKKAGKTVFVITHDEQYFHCADRILLMREGKLVDESMPDDIISFYKSSTVST